MPKPREILLPHGAAQKLAIALEKSKPTVRKALRFQESTNAEEVSLARKIRYVAIKEYGGVDTGAADMQRDETTVWWDYPNGARLAMSIKSGFMTLTKGGKVIDSQVIEGFTDAILDWQTKAENLA